jgi:hypothetical protein
MTVEELKELFDSIIVEESNKQSTWTTTFHRRKDINAMLLLDMFFKDCSFDMIDYAGHDEISFDVDLEELAKVITAEQVRELVRCGVRYRDDALYLYV